MIKDLPYVPSGSQLDRISHVANAALPAAGAFTNQSFQKIRKGTSRVTYWITYASGAGGGYPTFRHEYTNGTDVANEVIADPSSVTVDTPTFGYATVDMYAEQVNGPGPGLGGTATFALTYERLPAACTGVRLLCAEAGDTANPGTITVFLTTDVFGQS